MRRWWADRTAKQASVVRTPCVQVVARAPNPRPPTHLWDQQKSPDDPLSFAKTNQVVVPSPVRKVPDGHPAAAGLLPELEIASIADAADILRRNL